MSILVPDIAITEKVVRSVGVYLFLLVAFRVAGKRQLGQLTAFDLVVLLVTSNVLQNAAIGSDNSLGGELVGASAIIALNWKEGITTLSEIPYAILEEDGHGSVIPRRRVPA
jgi:uncharacterized membrane protein YcaP (DUF421 family)